MVKVTITPKIHIPGGNFFFDHDGELSYTASHVDMTNGRLLFLDRKTGKKVNHKMDTVNYFYEFSAN